jgi:tetratricopeptide (TPR) repeat protein
MRRVLTVAVAPTIERARVLNEAGWIASSLGDLDRSMALFQEALAIWQAHGDRVGAIRSLGYLGMGAGERGNVVEAVSYHAASLAMAREEGDARLLSIVLINAAEAALASGDHEAAANMLGEALAIARGAGDLIHTADALSDLAGVVLWQGDAPRAIALVREAIALHRDHRYDYGLIRSSLVLGAALVAAGERCEGERELATAIARCRGLGYKRDLALGLFSLAEAAETVEEGGRAAPHLAEALALVREVGDKANLARGLECAARLLVGRGEDEAAVRFGGAAAAVRAATGALPAPSWRASTDRWLTVARGRLGGGAFADAWAEGQARPADAVAAEAQRVLADVGNCPR